MSLMLLKTPLTLGVRPTLQTASILMEGAHPKPNLEIPLKNSERLSDSNLRFLMEKCSHFSQLLHHQI